MAEHRAEQILAAIAAKLAPITSATTVGRDHPYSYDDAQLPAVNIVMGSEKPQALLIGNATPSDIILEVEIELACKQSTTLSTTINQMRKDIQIALRADPTLGLAFVIDTLPGELAKPEQKDGDLPVMAATWVWLIQYRASLNDPST